MAESAPVSARVAIPKEWLALDPETKTDLLEWFNRTEVTNTDKRGLAILHRNGKFTAWDCTGCGERCYKGYPIDWGNYQGVRQIRYADFPGDDEKYTLKQLESMCDHCRMYGCDA